MRHEDNTGLTRTCGAPGARKRARRVREAVRGNGPADKAGTAPRADFTTHTSRAMRELIAARLWLTVCQLPAYAPELNPVEAVWSHLKRSLANLAKRNLGQLTALIKTRLNGCSTGPASSTASSPARPHALV
jgi:transposase